jgi:hypothetical protein
MPLPARTELVRGNPSTAVPGSRWYPGAETSARRLRHERGQPVAQGRSQIRPTGRQSHVTTEWNSAFSLPLPTYSFIATENVVIASLLDLAGTKAKALLDRIERKDYQDILELLDAGHPCPRSPARPRRSFRLR